MGLVDLDEAGEDAVRGASRIVRDEEREHRIQSVHKLDYSAVGVPAAKNLVSHARSRLDMRYTDDIHFRCHFK